MDKNISNYNKLEENIGREVKIRADRELNKVLFEELNKLTSFNIISEETPYVFLFHPQATVSVHQYVKGLSKPGPAGILHDIENVYIDTPL